MTEKSAKILIAVEDDRLRDRLRYSGRLRHTDVLKMHAMVPVKR